MITQPDGWIVSIAGSPNYRTAKELGLDLFKSLLPGAVGFRVDGKSQASKSELSVHYHEAVGQRVGTNRQLAYDGRDQASGGPSFSHFRVSICHGLF